MMMFLCDASLASPVLRARGVAPPLRGSQSLVVQSCVGWKVLKFPSTRREEKRMQQVSRDRAVMVRAAKQLFGGLAPLGIRNRV